MQKDSERVARIEEALRWISPRVERIESKLDTLVENHTFLKGKILGMSALVGFLSSLVVEFFRR